MKDLSLTPAGRLVEAARSLNDGIISLWVRADSARVVVLEQIWCEKDRGTGHASHALRTLLEHADRLDVDVRLQVHWLAYDPAEESSCYDELWALNDRKLDNHQLFDWYSRLGFLPEGVANVEDGEQKMVRSAVGRDRCLAPASDVLKHPPRGHRRRPG